MDRETFGKRLHDALGDSHEGRELTTDVCDEFYQKFLASKLRFKAWINIILNESGCWDCCADCRTECPNTDSQTCTDSPKYQ
jgi:hypothetical protein